MDFFGIFKKRTTLESSKITSPESSNHTIENYSNYIGDALSFVWNGDKYPHSFGHTKDFKYVDYWELRKRSLQLFVENPYCRGIIRRILRNEIFSGIVPNATPIASILFPNMDEMEREEEVQKYAEQMNNAFSLYSNNYEMFDCRQQMTFGEWQNQVRMESLLCGDGVIISRINGKTGLPMWEWINGEYIRNPSNYVCPEDHTIKHGVELDYWGRHVAYHIQTFRPNGEVWEERIPVKGKRSGRQIAWMVYGSERMIDDVRGEPLLASVLSILKELDRYRDAEERAAVVNAMLAYFIQRPVTSTVASRPTAGFTSHANFKIGGAAIPEQKRQPIKMTEPGTVIDDLAAGETIQSFQTNRPNVNYKAFEQAILDAVCWSLEIPPEIVMMKFQSSYSASRQANNEFEVYLKYRTFKNAKDFCQIVYEEFIIQAVATGIIKLPNFLDIFQDSTRWQEKAAWLSCAWTGLSRPAVDRQKDVNASGKALDEGLTTFDIEARRTCGLSFRQVMLQRKREAKLMEEMGFTPHANEDNNGKPAYNLDGTPLEEDEEENGTTLESNSLESSKNNSSRE